jgi:hypothetical protein
MGVRQRLSMRGDPSPNKRAGANLNPRLTLALVVPKSPTAPKGGVARPALCPGGEENAQRAPATKLWGPRGRYVTVHYSNIYQVHSILYISSIVIDKSVDRNK